MAIVKINGTLNGKDYYEFKGSMKEAIKFMHERQGLLESAQREILEEIKGLNKSISGLQIKVAGIGGTVALVVSIIVLLLRSLI